MTAARRRTILRLAGAARRSLRVRMVTSACRLPPPLLRMLRRPVLPIAVRHADTRDVRVLAHRLARATGSGDHAHAVRADAALLGALAGTLHGNPFALDRLDDTTLADAGTRLVSRVIERLDAARRHGAARVLASRVGVTRTEPSQAEMTGEMAARRPRQWHAAWQQAADDGEWVRARELAQAWDRGTGEAAARARVALAYWCLGDKDRADALVAELDSMDALEVRALAWYLGQTGRSARAYEVLARLTVWVRGADASAELVAALERDGHVRVADQAALRAREVFADGSRFASSDANRSSSDAPTSGVADT